MILIVGLGNPGIKYEKTHHNLGFMVADALRCEFSFSKKFNAEICQLSPDILIIKPQTFMNASGIAVAKIFRYYDIKILSNLWVVHDDVDLPLGKLKIRLGGAAAGHHGVESVIKELGTDNFVRFRLGIGHPQRGSDEQVEKYVLRSFDVNEKTEVKQMIKKTVKAIQKAIEQNLERAMNEFN